MLVLRAWYFATSAGSNLQKNMLQPALHSEGLCEKQHKPKIVLYKTCSALMEHVSDTHSEGGTDLQSLVKGMNRRDSLT